MTLQPYIPGDELSEMWRNVNQGPLTDADYEALKDAMPTYRDLLIVKMLRCTGLRINELLRMPAGQKQYDYTREAHCILVQRSKKRQETEYDPVYIPASLGVELDSYIKEHRRGSDEPIFQGTKPGQPLTSRAVEYVFEKVSLQIGRRVHPHMLRDYYSNYLLERGVFPHVASQLLGHNDVKTTLEHYHKLTTDKRRQIGEAIRP